MPRGKPKRGEFQFIVWFQDGARIEWGSTRQQTDAEIAAAIRRYLVPVMERLESGTTTDAVDPAYGVVTT